MNPDKKFCHAGLDPASSALLAAHMSLMPRRRAALDSGSEAGMTGFLNCFALLPNP
jgi:hypothetical protein